MLVDFVRCYRDVNKRSLRNLPPNGWRSLFTAQWLEWCALTDGWTDTVGSLRAAMSRSGLGCNIRHVATINIDQPFILCIHAYYVISFFLPTKTCHELSIMSVGSWSFAKTIHDLTGAFCECWMLFMPPIVIVAWKHDPMCKPRTMWDFPMYIWLMTTRTNMIDTLTNHTLSTYSNMIKWCKVWLPVGKYMMSKDW